MQETYCGDAGEEGGGRRKEGKRISAYTRTGRGNEDGGGLRALSSLHTHSSSRAAKRKKKEKGVAGRGVGADGNYAGGKQPPQQVAAL